MYTYILRHAFIRDRLSFYLFEFICSFEIERQGQGCFRDSDQTYHVIDLLSS